MINYVDFNNHIVYEFEKKFDMIFLKEFLSNNKIKLFNAFHDKDPAKAMILNLNDLKTRRYS